MSRFSIGVGFGNELSDRFDGTTAGDDQALHVPDFRGEGFLGDQMTRQICPQAHGIDFEQSLAGDLGITRIAGFHQLSEQWITGLRGTNAPGVFAGSSGVAL